MNCVSGGTDWHTTCCFLCVSEVLPINTLLKRCIEQFGIVLIFVVHSFFVTYGLSGFCWQRCQSCQCGQLVLIFHIGEVKVNYFL